MQRLIIIAGIPFPRLTTKSLYVASDNVAAGFDYDLLKNFPRSVPSRLLADHDLVLHHYLETFPRSFIHLPRHTKYIDRKFPISHCNGVPRDSILK